MGKARFHKSARPLFAVTLAASLSAGLGACQSQKPCCSGESRSECCEGGASCCGNDAEKPTALRVTDLKQVQGTWSLVSCEGLDVGAIRAAHPGADVGLTIDPDGGASGLAGVNRIRTKLDLASTGLLFAPAISTKMAGPEDLMQLELRFTAAIARTRELELRASGASEELTLADRGQTLATLRRVK